MRDLDANGIWFVKRARGRQEMQRRTPKTGKGGRQLPTAYSKADAFGGSKYEVSHIVGKGAYGVVWCGLTSELTPSAAAHALQGIASPPRIGLGGVAGWPGLRVVARAPSVLADTRV